MRGARSDPTPPLAMVMVRGWGWGLASALSVVVGARGADFAPFCLFWGPRGADFGHVCLFLLVFACFSVLVGLSLGPSVVLGPLWG